MNTDQHTQTIEPKGLKLHPEQPHAPAATTPHDTPQATASRILRGDCLKLLRELPADSVDMVLTDPPYLVRYKDRAGRSIDNDDNARWVYPAFSELYRVLKPDRFCLCFYGWSQAERFLAAWKTVGFSPVAHFVWVKRYASGVRYARAQHELAYLLAKGKPSMPSCPPSDVRPWAYTGNRLHPTQKPVSALVPLIETYCPVGGLVLDPFAGSGTTGAAARYCKHPFLLMEKDPAYFEAASRRLAC